MDHGKWAKIWVNSSGWIVEHCTPGLILHLDLQESVDLFGGCDHYSNFRCFRRNQRGYDRDMTVNNQMAALVHHTCLILACRILGENPCKYRCIFEFDALVWRLSQTSGENTDQNNVEVEVQHFRQKKLSL